MTNLQSQKIIQKYPQSGCHGLYNVSLHAKTVKTSLIQIHKTKKNLCDEGAREHKMSLAMAIHAHCVHAGMGKVPCNEALQCGG